MKKSRITVFTLAIVALVAGGYCLFVLPALNDENAVSADLEVEASALQSQLASGGIEDASGAVEALIDPLASISKAHVHGPNCNHADDAVVATAVKPLNHDVLPWTFENALSSDAETSERYFLMNDAAFSSLRKANVGDEVSIDLAHNVIVNGTLKALKTYPQDGSLLKGVIELSDGEGQLFFFQSSEKLNSNIVFNEKSVALVYEDGASGPAYVQTPISDLFCSSEGAVYPLNHPSNGKPFLQVSQ